MNVIVDWAKNLAFFVLFMNLAYQLLPEGNLQKYSKLFSGFLMILLLIEPVTGLLKLNDNLALLVKQAEQQMESAMDEKISSDEMRLESYEKQLKKQVAYILEKDAYEVEEIEVRLEQIEDEIWIEKLQIKVKGEYLEEEKEKLTENIANYLGLESAQVEIR